MFARPPPIEWVEGAAKTWFGLGNFVVLFGAMAIGQLIAEMAIPARSGPTGLVVLGWCGIMAALTVPVNLLYFAAVPCPRTLGLSPIGLTVDFVLRRKFFAWTDVVPRGREVICFSARGGWPTRVAVSGVQQERVKAYLAAYRSAAPGYAPNY